MKEISQLVDMNLVLAWPASVVALFLVLAMLRQPPGLYVPCYLVMFALQYWFGAFAYALPWHPFKDAAFTIDGFELSTWGLWAFLAGVLAASLSASSTPRHAPVLTVPLRIAGAQFSTIVLMVGAVTWFLTYTPAMSLPSAPAILSTASRLTLIGIALKCWIAWQNGAYSRANAWLAFAFVLPVITLMIEGFLGFGVLALSIVLSFVATFYRPRLLLAAGALALLYTGMSLSPAYGEHRKLIREAVWGGEDFEARFSTMIDMLQSMTPFDPSKDSHLHFIDERLNQSHLVGAGMAYTPQVEPFANGSTIAMVVLAMVPRAIWPDKPVQAGSGNLVSQYTGMNFADGTAVGIGHILELYVNGGTDVVLLGMFILGIALRLIDKRLMAAAFSGNWTGVLVPYLVGQCFLNVIGSMVEIGSSLAASVILGLVLSKAIEVWSPSAVASPDQVSVRQSR